MPREGKRSVKKKVYIIDQSRVLFDFVTRRCIGKTEGTAVPMDIVENDDWDHDYDEVPEIPYIEKKERKEVTDNFY